MSSISPVLLFEMHDGPALKPKVESGARLSRLAYSLRCKMNHNFTSDLPHEQRVNYMDAPSPNERR
uniref:Uncharacterized protein n=1 Tax=Picea glauca TaxID=3330 RepID=A0A101M5E5_PICGL|nr:hypothetical protein ABT39_MTgene1160 [Picea glauca]